MNELLSLEEQLLKVLKFCLWDHVDNTKSTKAILRSLYSDPLFNTRKVKKSTQYINPNVLHTVSNVPVLAPHVLNPSKIIRVGSAVFPERIY